MIDSQISPSRSKTLKYSLQLTLKCSGKKVKNNLWILSVWHGFGNKKGITNKDKYMTLRQLISTLTYFAEVVEDFDIDEEVIVNLCDKNGKNIAELPIIDTDWNWKDFFDSEKRKKIVTIYTQMTD